MILDSDDDSEDESYENESCKVTKNIHAYSLFQMMVYILNNGKVKTPLHVMTGTKFKPVVIVEVLLQAKLEFQSDIMKLEGPVHCLLLTPFKMQERKQFEACHFGTGSQAGLVSGAFDNMNMKDKSSASGTKTTDYCTLVLFLDVTYRESYSETRYTRCWKSQCLTEGFSCK